MQVQLSDQTIERIEAITGKKFTRGADKMINEVIDTAEGLDPNDKTPKVVMCAGMQGALQDA